MVVIVAGSEFGYVIVTVAVNFVVNHVSQNFQYADVPVANESGSALELVGMHLLLLMLWNCWCGYLIVFGLLMLVDCSCL